MADMDEHGIVIIGGDSTLGLKLEGNTIILRLTMETREEAQESHNIIRGRLASVGCLHIHLGVLDRIEKIGRVN